MNGVPLDRPTARLTWLYVAALTAVAVLSLTGQILVQHSLRQQRGDSTVINLAGRQRMLSQKLTKAALAWNYATRDEERIQRSQEIRTTLALWQRSHRGLQDGDAELSLVASRSPTVVAQFAKLQPIFEEMVAAAEQLLAATESQGQQQQLNRLLAREPQFLASMDAVVFQLDHEARTRVARLQQIEWLLLTLTLLVLVCEGILVFRPAVQRIRQAAQELQVAKEAAESANEQKTRFLATLSHELRNPLHAILGNAQLALESSLAPEQRNYVTTIDQSAQALLQLVNDLLDLACIQAGKLRVQLTAIDLRNVAQRCAAMIQPLAHRKGLRFTTDLPPGELVVHGDALRVQQVLLNLLGNAVKFTDQGHIRLHAIKQEKVLRIEVSDTGPGIPLEMQQSIFAAFTQVDGSTRREFSGVGLGLAISAGLVELMNGKIGVESEPGHGSRFWFELPLSAEVPKARMQLPRQPVAGC
jgi:signal transduction histidine kinase